MDDQENDEDNNLENRQKQAEMQLIKYQEQTKIQDETIKNQARKIQNLENAITAKTMTFDKAAALIVKLEHKMKAQEEHIQALQ